MGESIRQSNMELLRLLAMFLILLLHANNTVFNKLDAMTLVSRPTYALSILLIESLANVSVNVFVLISGWFGIKAKLRGISNVVFQPVFYSVLFILAALAFGFSEPFHPKSLANVFLFTKNYWYIKAYIGLYILSPVLNAYVETASTKQMLVILSLFFTYQAVYGCSESAPDFYLGYSIISFCGLYLLGRYLRIHTTKIKELAKAYYISAYISIAILITALAFIAIKADSSGFLKRTVFAYCNPLVIVQSAALLLLFNRFSFQNKAINWAAVSCLSVYLIHENINLQQLFRQTAHTIYTGNIFLISFMEIIVYIAVVFAASILLDQLRIAVWKRIERCIPDKTIAEI